MTAYIYAGFTFVRINKTSVFWFKNVIKRTAKLKKSTPEMKSVMFVSNKNPSVLYLIRKKGEKKV